MIKVQTILKVADNSGAVYVCCIRLLNISKRLGAKAGDLIKVSVKKSVAKKNIKKSKEIKKGQLSMALIIRTVRGLRRWGNFFIKASSNCVIIVNQYLLPVATRLFGPIFREIRQNVKYSKVIAMSEVSI